MSNTVSIRADAAAEATKELDQAVSGTQADVDEARTHARAMGRKYRREQAAAHSAAAQNQDKFYEAKRRVPHVDAARVLSLNLGDMPAATRALLAMAD